MMKKVFYISLVGFIALFPAKAAFSSSSAVDISGDEDVVFFDTLDEETGLLSGGFEQTYPVNYCYETEPLNYSSPNCTKLIYNGKPESKLDIVFVPVHQYGQVGPLSKFTDDVETFMREFREFPQFQANRNKINFYRIDALDEYDGCQSYQNNPICDRDRILEIASQCTGFSLSNNDQVVILFDDLTVPVSYSRADFNYNMTFMRTNAPYLMMHEFGHSFGKLGDEYDTGVPASVNPWFPNCSNSTPNYTCEDKWGDQIGQSSVGCFQGCGPSNWFRPTNSDSVMRNVFLDHYCPVGSRVVEDRLSIYSDKSIPIPVRFPYMSANAL